MNRECEKYESMLADALGGELTDADQPAFQAHLESCDRCNTEYEKASRTLSELREQFFASEHADSSPENALPQTTATFRPTTLLRYAAAIALAFSAGYMLNRPTPSGDSVTPITHHSGTRDNTIRERLVSAHHANPEASDFSKSLQAVLGSRNQ